MAGGPCTLDDVIIEGSDCDKHEKQEATLKTHRTSNRTDEEIVNNNTESPASAPDGRTLAVDSAALLADGIKGANVHTQ
eukprot:2442488-Amphidinium_carterae.1